MKKGKGIKERIAYKNGIKGLKLNLFARHIFGQGKNNNNTKFGRG